MRALIFMMAMATSAGAQGLFPADVKDPDELRNLEYLYERINILNSSVTANSSIGAGLASTQTFSGINTFTQQPIIGAGAGVGTWVAIASATYTTAVTSVSFSGLASSVTYRLEFELLNAGAAAVLYASINDVKIGTPWAWAGVGMISAGLVNPAGSALLYYPLQIESGTELAAGGVTGHFGFTTIFGSSHTIRADGFSMSDSATGTNVHFLTTSGKTSSTNGSPTSVQLFFAAINEGATIQSGVTGRVWLYRRLD